MPIDVPGFQMMRQSHAIYTHAHCLRGTGIPFWSLQTHSNSTMNAVTTSCDPYLGSSLVPSKSSRAPFLCAATLGYAQPNCRYSSALFLGKRDPACSSSIIGPLSTISCILRKFGRRSTLHTVWAEHMGSLNFPARRAFVQCCDILQCFACHLPVAFLHVRCLLFGHCA